MFFDELLNRNWKQKFRESPPANSIVILLKRPYYCSFRSNKCKSDNDKSVKEKIEREKKFSLLFHTLIRFFLRSLSLLNLHTNHLYVYTNCQVLEERMNERERESATMWEFERAVFPDVQTDTSLFDVSHIVQCTFSQAAIRA